MVQILVRMNDETANWTIVELQGSLETREEISLEGQVIGDLHFDMMGTPQMIIGHHLLTGKLVELDKPFAVLKKKSVDKESVAHDEINEQISDGSTCQTEYSVVALIRKKILFKNRPKPIIIKTAPLQR